jgi:hypothetical protein
MAVRRSDEPRLMAASLLLSESLGRPLIGWRIAGRKRFPDHFVQMRLYLIPVALPGTATPGPGDSKSAQHAPEHKLTDAVTRSIVHFFSTLLRVASQVFDPAQPN